MYYIYTIINDKIYVIGEDKLTEVIIENGQLVATENTIPIPESFDNIYTYNELAYKYGLNIEDGGEIVGGTDNYLDLRNKPKINGVELTGNKTSEDLGITGGDGIVTTLSEDFNIWKLEDGLYYIPQKVNMHYNTGNGTNVEGFLVKYKRTSDATYPNKIVGISKDYYIYGECNNSGSLGHYKELNNSKFLVNDNTSQYNVTNDYNPAHKKYVDDTISNAIANIPSGGDSVIKVLNEDVWGYSIESGLYYIPNEINIFDKEGNTGSYSILKGKLLLLVDNHEFMGFGVWSFLKDFYYGQAKQEKTTLDNLNIGSIQRNITSYNGYNSEKTQTLKNVNGALTWVTDEEV